MANRTSSSRTFTLAALALLTCAILQAQPRLPDPDGAARLVSFTGQISVLRDGNTWALNVGESVRPQQVVVSGPDGYAVFKVADGSTFEVFPNSRVAFRANPGNWTDLLEVWLGKVRVQIEHFGGLPNNNKVRTPSAVISVRGTIFDVEVDDDTQVTTVLDEEGSVEVEHLLRPSSKILHAGEWIRVYKNDPLAKANIDRGDVMRRALRAAADALRQVAINGPRTGPAPAGSTTAGVGAGGPADKNNGAGNTSNGGGSAPPPPPPPPPPAPPQ